MRVSATFSKGMGSVLEGRAIGDELTVTARARIVGADEALIEVTGAGAPDSEFMSGELEVRLLLSHPVAVADADALADPARERIIGAMWDALRPREPLSPLWWCLDPSIKQAFRDGVEQALRRAAGTTPEDPS